ncbi:phospholipase C [Burkholderia pseudomallei]|uniref:phospholipase C n=1 Tax=Burkholderia pseudomallei TaxID=28450 RepID=UPI0005385B7F|nr:alkaline phosphatase family protein [Burkholderia pseudomallei]KGX09643.1 phosphoesterase family protein [Burkholderia pseudomallei]KGX27535.1 phosphoesterase family protein [Burkholderia pseudomallei]KKB67573.1 phosphoesterase family protein [Burkholderia pseudomallei MSHR1079]OMZ19153.1 phospholipase [Burkholderia pseudomallei]OMZ21805.1 phospholipase [Burkholderia pseudomallei]
MFRRAWIATACAGSAIALYACGGTDSNAPVTSQNALRTATPIKHLVVIYGENVSFDHYFGTYPNAANPPGEPAFSAASGTPSINGLSGLLLTANPNATNPANGAGASNPFRLDRTQAATADQNHAYTAEEQAYDNGLADLFPKYTGNGSSGGAGAFGTTGQVMGYFDGNTVTALWNYAQRFAMSDNAYTSTYGPSTPGALNVIAGQTDGMQIVKTSKAVSTLAKTSYYINDGQGGLTMINDVDPGYDVCSSTTDQAMMSGKNIGDLLNARNVTWGGFMGGFNLSTTNANGTTGCKRSTIATAVNAATTDYIPHHNWFQYYASTANPQHTRPSSIAAIGSSVQTDGKTPEPANHQYDSDDFFAAVKAGNFPSVSFLKAPAAQDAHAGYSDPLDEQQFVTKVVNFLQQQPDWASTAVIVTYDDSDGWYDHAYTAPTRASFDAVDQLNGNGTCGSGAATTGINGAAVNGRCGPGTRIPFVVVSPWAKQNYVGHTLIDQASVVRFIEDNWLGSQRIGGGSFDATAGDMRDLFDFSGAVNKTPLYLDPTLGTKLATAPSI